MTSQSGWTLANITDSRIMPMSLKASKLFLEESIRVGKEESGTSTFNQSYDKLQAKEDWLKVLVPLCGR